MDMNRTNAWLEYMIGNNSAVSEWKENFRLSQATPSLFTPHFISCCRGSKQLVSHFIVNVPGVVTMWNLNILLKCKRQRIRIL